NRLLSLYGIVNGTSNYILTKMTEAGRPFDEVLKEAQKAGYAEADPTFDVQGIDAAHKLAILMNLAFGTPVNFKDVYVEGIASIVVMRVIDIARNMRKGTVRRVPPCAFQPDQRRPLRIRPIAEISSLYYLRFMVLDRPGVLSQLSGILGKHDISISSVLQRGR